MVLMVVIVVGRGHSGIRDHCSGGGGHGHCYGGGGHGYCSGRKCDSV